MKINIIITFGIIISLSFIEAAYAASSSIWGSADRGPVLGTYRIPVDTNSSSTPGYVTPTELQTFLTPAPGNVGLLNTLGGEALLPHWNKALANVMSKKGNARILCVGDSTTQGYWANNGIGSSTQMAGLSFCGQLSNIINGVGIPSTTNSLVGSSQTVSDRSFTDGRIVVGSAWVAGNFVALGGNWYTATGTTGNLAYTPNVPVDTFVVWYPVETGLGTLNYNIDGGANTGISQAGTAAFAKTVITVPLGNHTINFNYGSGSSVFVNAVEAYDSTKPQVLVENAGIDAAKVSTWNSSIKPYSVTPACGTYAPDLVIINLQINDMIQGTALATYQAGLQTLITGCQAGGTTDVLMMTSNHTNPADTTDPTSEATQATYAAAIRAVAATNSNSGGLTAGLPVADEFANLVSYNFQNTQLGAVYTPGTYAGDLHLNWYGYGIMARDLATVLLPAGGVPNPGYGAEQTIDFQPGLLTSVINTKGVYGKFVKASFVDNIEASALSFTCGTNPTITLYECGTSASCTSPTTIGSVTVTTSGTVVDGTITAPFITAGDYVAWALTAGVCTALDIAATAQVHSN